MHIVPKDNSAEFDPRHPQNAFFVTNDDKEQQQQLMETLQALRQDVERLDRRVTALGDSSPGRRVPPVPAPRRTGSAAFAPATAAVYGIVDEHP